MDRKHNEVFDGLLPIGSVVTSKTGTKKLMIIGRGIERKDGKKGIYDYGAVLFPEGYAGGDQLYLFDHKDVGTIFRVGYMNYEENELEDRISAYLKQ